MFNACRMPPAGLNFQYSMFNKNIIKNARFRFQELNIEAFNETSTLGHYLTLLVSASNFFSPFNISASLIKSFHNNPLL